MSEPKVIVTLPADQQQIDETGYVFSFLHEAPEPDRLMAREDVRMLLELAGARERDRCADR